MWTPPQTAKTTAEQFLAYSAWNLRDYNLPKIIEAVALLSDQEIWQREGETSNCIGNLLLHLAGNVRQHIICGVGGETDTRDRPVEFAMTGGIGGEELLARLEETVNEAARVLEAFDPKLLLEKRVIQNNEVVLMDDIYHVVEHFSYHTGQILFVVKARKSHKFDWYASLDTKIK